MSDTTAGILRTFELEMRRRLVEGVRAGRSLPELEAEVRAVIWEMRPQARLATSLEVTFETMRRRVAEEIRIDYVAERTPGDFPLSSEMIATTLHGWSRLETVLETSVIEAIDAAMRRGANVSEVENVVASKLGVARHRAETIANTGVAQISRATRFEVGTQAGLDRMRYAGPAADREFCVERLREAARGITYTIAEIRAMDNGQGLSVLTSCGGYNCIHRLLWVV